MRPVLFELGPYETLASLLILAVLWRLRQRVPPLRTFAVYLVLAGAERLLVEFIRRNEEVLLGLTQPQLFALAMLVAGAVVLVLPARTSRTSPRDISISVETLVRSALWLTTAATYSASTYRRPSAFGRSG